METKDFLALKQNPVLGSSGQDNLLQSQQRLLMRIEELEDLVVELKNQQTPNEIIELKTLLILKEQEISKLNLKVDELKKVKVGAKNLFDGNELYQTFQSAVNERNDLILKLKKELSALKNAKFITSLQQQSPSGLPLAQTATLGAQNQMPEQLQMINQTMGRHGSNGRFNTYTQGWPAGEDERDQWLVQKLPSEMKAI